MSDFSPFWAEMSDVELVMTQSRIKAWRRKRRRSRHFCPQCGQFWDLKLASLMGENSAAGVSFPEKPRVAGLFTDALQPRRN